MLERAHFAASGVHGVPEVVRHLVAVGGVGLQDSEALRVELFLRVLGHRLGLRIGSGHVAEDVLAERREPVGAGERDHRNAELLSARRRGQPFGDAEGPEDGDDPALGKLLDRLGRGVRLALRVDDLHLHLAAALQVEGEGDAVERLIRESLQVSRQRQDDADEIGAHSAPLRGLLHCAGAVRVRALRLRGEHVARQV